MQCVILAAGNGKRLRPLTNDRPKPMVSLLGKPLLEHIIDRLPEQITECIIVIGYRGEQIQRHFGRSWCGRPIRYVVQEEQNGPAAALFLCRELVRDRFLLMYADDIPDTESLARGLHHNYCIFAKEHEHPERFGVIERDAQDRLVCITEKPEQPASNLVSTGPMVLRRDIFDTTLIKHPVKDEYFIPDLLMQVVARESVRVAEQREWLTVTTPDDIPLIERILRSYDKQTEQTV